MMEPGAKGTALLVPIVGFFVSLGNRKFPTVFLMYLWDSRLTRGEGQPILKSGIHAEIKCGGEE